MKRFGATEYSIWFSLLSIAGVIITFLTVLGHISGTESHDQAAQMQDAIERAATQCYALEGAYPPNIEYLEHYGIHINTDELYVDYRPYGANLRPDIYVAPLNDQAFSLEDTLDWDNADAIDLEELLEDSLLAAE